MATNQHQVPPLPGEFLRQVATAHPGWSAPYGGPEGVARATLTMQDVLKVQASELAAVRAAAIEELLTTRSLSEVARMLGVSKQAVSKSVRSPRWSDPRW